MNNIDMDALMKSFQVMGQGMFGIFVVIVLISLIVVLLSKITNKAPKKPSDDK